MRFHSLAVPHNICHKDYSACAYQMKALKFARMMTERGHTVITYGVEGMQTESTEEVVVVDTKTYERVYGDHDYRQKFFKYDTNDEVYQTFYRNAISEIGKRKQQHDFLLPWWGWGHKTVCDAHNDLIVVEPGIGYSSGHFARWKIFESYALLHAYKGTKSAAYCDMDYYETVIPNYFDVSEFEFAPEQKEDYFLYLGRVYEGKGIHIAIQTTKEIGARLVIAGQKPDDYNFPSHVEFVGYADVQKRKRLMSKARASFMPSLYIEPFGGVMIENFLSGTPVITTDWGSFAENNVHGVTGYRCRTFDDFCWAANNIDNISPFDCRKHGLNYTLEKIAPQYEHYFQSVLDVYTGKGWYQRHDTNKLDSKTRTL
jgi:glycosyltransferase involved in cell wall biosynthesis